jgi:hypothetical protein
LNVVQISEHLKIIVETHEEHEIIFGIVSKLAEDKGKNPVWISYKSMKTVMKQMLRYTDKDFREFAKAIYHE